MNTQNLPSGDLDTHNLPSGADNAHQYLASNVLYTQHLSLYSDKSLALRSSDGDISQNSNVYRSYLCIIKSI